VAAPAIAQTTGIKKSAGGGVGCASHHSLFTYRYTLIVSARTALLFPVGKILCVQGSIYSLFLYDAVYLYMTMMNQIVSERLDWRNGTFWRNMARNWVTIGQ